MIDAASWLNSADIAIQKAIESYRIPQEKKDHLRTLKIK